MERKSAEEQVTHGTGNVFADIGRPDAPELLAKAQLLSTILDTIEERKLTQAQVAKLTGLDQPKVSKLVNGRIREFSTVRLMHILNELGQDVQIVIIRHAPDDSRAGKTQVVLQHGT